MLAKLISWEELKDGKWANIPFETQSLHNGTIFLNGKNLKFDHFSRHI